MASAAAEDELAYLSLNPKITDARCLGPEPSEDELERMRTTDPKLRYSWAIWEQLQQPKEKALQYSEATREICRFSTVKDFWACYNHIPQPSELLDGKKFMRESADGTRTVVEGIMFFRQGIRPEWEDEMNTNGGHLQMLLKPQLGGGAIDELWNNCVLGVISGCIQPVDMITGIRLMDKLNAKGKPALRIEVWFDKFDDQEVDGDVYNLRGSLEQCLRQGLDGKQGPMIWGGTEVKSHVQSSTPHHASASPHAARTPTNSGKK